MDQGMVLGRGRGGRGGENAVILREGGGCKGINLRTQQKNRHNRHKKKKETFRNYYH